MVQPLEVSDCQELVRLTRNGVVESRLLGVAVVLDATGNVLRKFGKPGAQVFARSALKPFQAIGSLRCGAILNDAQLALACGSHAGSFEQQRAAAAILAEAGLDSATLQCPSAWPADPATRSEMIRQELDRTALAFNCSGKHAAFLNAAVHSVWDTADYLEPGHPVQQAALEAIAQYCGALSFTGTDGCGAPAPMLSLTALASGYSQLMLATKEIDPLAARVRGAMLRHPQMVQGAGKPNTVASEQTGVIAKLGAEGVLAMAAPDGTAVAIKMLDGSLRGADQLALRLLAEARALDPEPVARALAQLTGAPVTSGQRASQIQLVLDW